MNPNIKNLLPSHYGEYKISSNKHLANKGIDIFNYFLENDMIKPTHTYKDITYRWSYGGNKNHIGMCPIDFISNNLPQPYKKTFEEDIINFLGLKELQPNEIKFEILGPNEYVDDIHLRRTRFQDIEAIKEDNIPSTDYENEIFFSGLWHTDKAFDLSNYKLLIYLNDVEIDGGGLVLADPVVSPKNINGECVLFKEGYYIPADKIPEKEITGGAGTTASFSSHILHRGNLPKKGFRYCLHLSFLLEDEHHTHPPYSKTHFIA